MLMMVLYFGGLCSADSALLWCCARHCTVMLVLLWCCLCYLVGPEVPLCIIAQVLLCLHCRAFVLVLPGFDCRCDVAPVQLQI